MHHITYFEYISTLYKPKDNKQREEAGVNADEQQETQRKLQLQQLQVQLLQQEDLNQQLQQQLQRQQAHMLTITCPCCLYSSNEPNNEN